jgi:hypothetical protein
MQVLFRLDRKLECREPPRHTHSCAAARITTHALERSPVGNSTLLHFQTHTHTHIHTYTHALPLKCVVHAATAVVIAWL